MKLATRTGRVFEFSPAIITGIRNSFQERSETNIPVATKPGAANGKIIRVNNLKVEAPSTLADSSISTGICSKKLINNQIANGILNPAKIRINPNFES
jgi:hypothetical protein